MELQELENFLSNNSEKVINLVNNIVYHSENKSNYEIDTEIKSKLQNAFVGFFGKKHTDQIQYKMDFMNIFKGFHIWGSRNSISQFLLDEKAKMFNKGQENKIKEPETLAYFVITPIEEILEEAEFNAKSRERLESVCRNIGFDIFSLDSQHGQDVFKNIVEDIYSKYLNTPYSENVEKNEQMEFLEKYVNMYKEYISQTYQNSGSSVANYKDNIEEIERLDPVFNQITKYFNDSKKQAVCEGLFLTTSTTSAFEWYGDIFLGINPENSDIIHEAFHAVTTKSITNTGIYKEEIHKYFNEVVTDYYSENISKKFLLDNPEGLTINENKTSSAYECYLFEYMSSFMDVYGPEFKECLMREDPVTAIKSIIGGKNFDTIAENCDTVFRLAHDANCYNFSCLLGEELTEDTNNLIKKKPLIERVFNSVANKSEDVANKLKGSNTPHLQLLAKGIYGLSEILNSLNQRKVSYTIDTILPKNMEDDVMSF